MSILVIDVGSSSLRGIVFDDSGKIQHKIQREYTVMAEGNCFAEIDANIVLESCLDVLKNIGEWLKSRDETIRCISVTAQRSSVIAVDVQGRPLKNAMTWQDTRASGICCELQNQIEKIYHICGMRPSPVFSAPKMQYLKRNFKQIYDMAYKLIGFQEFILFNLTGCFATDKTFANRTGLFDISTQEWSKELIDVYGVDKNKLCKIVEVGDTIGKTTQKITQILGVENSIDVISSGGDQQCASVGLGCLDVGDIEVNSGTGSFIIGVSDKPVFDEKMRVNCNISSIQGKWIVEGSVLSAGRAVDYINDLMFKDESEKHSYENINKFAALSPKGARGLRIIPHFAGSGTPDWDSSAKAEIKNLSFANKKEDFARGIFEGIAIEMENCIEIVAQIIGKENEAISVAGGLTKSQTYNEIQADVYGKRTLVSSNCEATGIGAFIVASVKIGLFKSYREAFNSATKQDVINAYEPDLVANQMYKKIYK